MRKYVYLAILIGASMGCVMLAHAISVIELKSAPMPTGAPTPLGVTTGNIQLLHSDGRRAFYTAKNGAIFDPSVALIVDEKLYAPANSKWVTGCGGSCKTCTDPGSSVLVRFQGQDYSYFKIVRLESSAINKLPSKARLLFTRPSNQDIGCTESS